MHAKKKKKKYLMGAHSGEQVKNEYYITEQPQLQCSTDQSVSSTNIYSNNKISISENTKYTIGNCIWKNNNNVTLIIGFL